MTPAMVRIWFFVGSALAVPLAVLAAGIERTAPAAQPEPGPPGVQGEPQTPSGAEPQAAAEPAKPPTGELYINDRFGYALRRPRDWDFRFEPGLDVAITPPKGDAEIQIVARSFFDVRLQQIPEGPVTLELRAAARASGHPFEAVRRCLDPALRRYLQLFWLDSYVAWHTGAAAEEYAGFAIESRRALQLAGNGGIELVYTLEGKRRPGTQKIKTIIVAYDERICQLSYLARRDHFDEDLKAFHAVVNSLYLHRDRS